MWPNSWCARSNCTRIQPAIDWSRADHATRPFQAANHLSLVSFRRLGRILCDPFRLHIFTELIFSNARVSDGMDPYAFFESNRKKVSPSSIHLPRHLSYSSRDLQYGDVFTLLAVSCYRVMSASYQNPLQPSSRSQSDRSPWPLWL